MYAPVFNFDFGYIYKTTNLVNGKVYIGQSHGKFKSTYLGSGTILKKAIKKYGKANFNVELFGKGVDQNNLNELEKFWIKEMKRIKFEDNVYNVSVGGSSEFVGDHREKRPNCSGINHPFFGIKGDKHPNYGKKRSDAFKLEKSRQMTGKGNNMFGKHHTEATIEKLRKASTGKHPSAETILKMKKNHPDTSGSKNPMFGKKVIFSAETIEKFRQASTGRHPTDKTIVKMRESQKRRWSKNDRE